MYRVLTITALLLPACTDHYGSPTLTSTEYGASTWQWLDGYPNRVDISWREDSYNCVGDGDALCDGGQAHQIRIKSITCDGCTVSAATDASFSDAITVYAQPTVVGVVKITGEVETSDGNDDTASMQLAADRVVSLAADCEVNGADFSTLGTCDQLAHRPANSVVDIVSLATTSHGDSIAISSYLPADGGDPQFRPELGPDAAARFGNADFELTGPTAATETLSWDGFADPIAIRIPPIQ